MARYDGRNASLPLADHLDSWRRTVTAAVLCGLTLALGLAALVGAVTFAYLTVTRPVLVVVAFGAALWLVLRRQGGLAAIAAALWHVGNRWGGRSQTVNRRRLPVYREDWPR